MPHITDWIKIALIISGRYFIIAGLGWLVWYYLLRPKLAFKKIQLRFPVSKDYRREIAYSLSTILIFTSVTVLLLFTPVRKYTQFYTDINQHGRVWFWLAFPILFFVHDTYFYFMHRLIHHKKLFKLFHVVHHKSTNPSPWAALAFQPMEALTEIGVLVLILFLIPLTRIHLFAFFLVLMVYNVYGHLGWELFPKGFNKTFIGKWINTSVNHNQHHQYFEGNYGLYFLWWDRALGTLREDYDQKFDEVKNRKIAADNLAVQIEAKAN